MIEFYRAMVRRQREWRHEDRGASGVEYGLLIAAVAAVIVGIAFVVGTFVHNAFQTTCDELDLHDTTTASCATP